MKQVSKFLAPVAFAAAALCAPQAYALNQFSTSSVYLPGGGGTYIGIMDPTGNPSESATVTGNIALIPSTGTFTDFWVVDIIPTGNVIGSMTFTDIGGSYSAFNVSIFLAQAPLTSVATAAFTCTSQSRSGIGAVSCPTGPGGLSLIPQTQTTFGIPGQIGFGGSISTTFVAAGRYVVRVTGTTSGPVTTNPAYTGTIQVNQVPEPGTLALAGLALLGGAAAMRKRKAS